MLFGLAWLGCAIEPNGLISLRAPNHKKEPCRIKLYKGSGTVVPFVFNECCYSTSSSRLSKRLGNSKHGQERPCGSKTKRQEQP